MENNEDDEKSLLGSDDELDTLLDEMAVESKKEKEIDLEEANDSESEAQQPKAAKKVKKRRLKKKKDIAKEDEEDEEVPESAAHRLKGSFDKSLKRKRGRSGNDGDEDDEDSVDRYLKSIADDEISSLYDSDNESSNEEQSGKRPPKKRKRLAEPEKPIAPSSSNSSSNAAEALANSLFDNGDLELEDVEETPRRPGTLFDKIDDPMETDANDDDDAASKKKKKNAKEEKPGAPSAAVETRPIIHDGWPVLAGDNEEIIIRCTYAEMRNGPLRLLTKTTADANNNGSPPLAVQESAWGIFVPHGHRPPRPKQPSKSDDDDEDDLEKEDNGSADGASTSANNNDDLGAGGDLIDADRGNDTGSTFVHAPTSERSWFLVVGEATLMRTLASPLFTHRVRMVKVNPEHVVFTYKTTVPIYYAYDLLEKRGLWTNNASNSWTPIQLARILVDTLYIHLELYNTNDRSSQLEHVLSSVKGFPLHSDPANKMLPPDYVSLNDYSIRKDRSNILRSKFTSLVKMRDKAAASLGGLPLVYCRDLMACELRCKPFLFTDMEKPASAWLMLERGVPYSSIGALTTWSEPNYKLIKERYAATRPLYETDLSKVVVNELKALATRMRLDPQWYADWIGGLETKELLALYASSYTSDSTPEQRLHKLKLTIYAVFCASYFWHSYHEKRAKYNANNLYIFTKDACEDLFHRGWHTVSQVTRTNLLLGNAPTEAQGDKYQVVEISEEDQQTLKTETRAVLKFMSAKQAQNSELEKSGSGIAVSPPMLVEAGTSWALVNSNLVNRINSMKKFILEVGMRWAAWKREGILTEPLSLLPPLSIQSAYLYGPSTLSKPDSMYRSLTDAVKATYGDKCMVSVVRAGEDPSRVFSTLKENMQKTYIVIMDRFHIWSESLMDTVLEVLTSLRTPSQCCHIFITAHANSLADMNTSGFLMDDLVDVAQRLQSVLEMGTSAGASSNEAFWLGSSSRFTRLQEAGTASALLFPLAQREEQLEVNRDCLLGDNSTLTTVITKFASSDLSDMDGVVERCPILILFALTKTERALTAMLTENDPNWRLNHVTLVSYETLARCPSQTAGDRRCIVFYDINYTGAGRPTYIHINAAFERLAVGGRIFIFGADQIRQVVPEVESPSVKLARSTMRNRSVSKDGPSASLSSNVYFLSSHLQTFINVFLANDVKTDRLATRNQRLSLLKTAVNTSLANPRVMQTLAVAK